MPASEVFQQLLDNLAYLFTLTFIYGLISPYLNHCRFRTQASVRGLLFGGFGIVAMLNTIQITPGYFLDGRAIILVIAGIFGGSIPALIAVMLIGLFRMSLGGDGLTAALATAMTCTLLGIWVHHQYKHMKLKISLPLLLILGVLMALQRIIWISLLDGTNINIYLEVTLIPFLIFYPIGTALLGLLLLWQQRQQQTEAALQTSELRYRQVVNAMSEGILVYDANGTVTTSNPSAERILGVSTEQLISRTADRRWHVIHEDGSSFAGDQFPILVTLCTGQAQFNVVMGVYQSDDTLVWVNVNTQPLFLSDNNTLSAVLGTFTDITQQRQAQEKLQEEHDLLRTFIDSTPDYIFIKDVQGHFILSNTAHAQVGRLLPHELMGKTAFDIFPIDLATQYHADDQLVMQSGQPLINAERPTIDDTGQPKIVLTTKIPLRDRAGKLIGLIGISRDITERKELEKQTVELATQRERVQLLEHFIRDMSHDFRTPLAIINSSLYLFKKNTDPHKQQAHLEKLELQILRLSKLLDEILQMSNLDRQDVVFQFHTMDVNGLLSQLIQKLDPILTTKQLTCNFIADVDPCMAHLDEVEFSHCMLNLIENAISYTPPGGCITLHTSLQNDWLVIAVQDTGIGITADNLPHIFDRFYRADQARSIDTGGSGLGLSMVQKIVAAHHGTIEVNSIVGQGSTFTIKLPISQPLLPENILQ